MNGHKLCGAVVAAVLAAAGPGLASAAQAEGRYIVAFRPGSAAGANAALRAAGARVVLSLGPQNAAAAVIPDRAVDALGRNPNIEYIEVDATREPYALWNDVATGNETLPYGIQMVQANLVTSASAASRKVCIIDSGYSWQHEDLKDPTTGAVTANTTDTGSGSWDKDSCGHGSHVAGTISAIAGNVGVVGANPGVLLHIVKVFGDNALVDGGNCGWTYSSTLVDALNKCVAAGANVVSMSLGGGGRSRTEDRAFATAYKQGVLSIAAAGNAGNNTTSYPAGYDSVMSVAAVDANETHASFSQTNRDVEIAAPGVAVLSTVPWYDRNSLAADGVAWFGGRIEGAARTTGVSGGVVDGGQCTASGAWAGRVVLCQRGTNSFADKVSKVQAGGGVAAAIYNNVASDATCGVFSGTLGTGVTSSLPAITLSCQDGAAALGHAGSSGLLVSSFEAPSSGYEAWDGTSMATPHVSAVAALVWSCNPTWKAADIRNALDATAKDVGAAGRDTSYGYGIVQAKAALVSLGLGSCQVR
ncbi:S8 family serine peptidase [Anaeromyxobacter soli]|uniref:S8 family serine peptidase n=1 Tax=Anaeromyxobacter soli TaxID=2922725 RepID=UPI001FAEC320|nr:S8 family serine peptidase [Anaeromyxobacter sp. SG29]